MKKQCHPYYLKNSWNSIDKVVSYIINNIVYNKDGLIVINKPYGIMQKPVQSNSAGVLKSILNTAAAGTDSYTLQEVLPYIAHALRCKKLHIVKMPERYESGVGVLASTEAVVEKVSQCFKRAKPLQQSTRTYRGLVVGVPQPRCASNVLGIKLQVLPDGDKQAMLTKEWSKMSVHRGDVKVVNANHRTLSTNAHDLASLVEVETSVTKWHFVRLYLSYLLSPVLGDNLFASRVAEVLGQKVMLPPSNDATKLPQKLSSELMHALRLQQGWEVMVPVHMHLHQLTLINYLGKGKDLVLQAPLPEVFTITCQWLGLEVPHEHSHSQTVSLSSSSVHS